MQVVEVGENARYKKEFIQFPVRLYKADSCWIRPLDTDVEEVFDPVRNKRFEHGECIRYLLLNDKGETIGRVAAFIDHEIANLDNDQPTGGLGFLSALMTRRPLFGCLTPEKPGCKAAGWKPWMGPLILATVIAGGDC